MLEIVRPSQKSWLAVTAPSISGSDVFASLQRGLDRFPGELGDAHVVAAGRGPRLAQANDPGVGASGHGAILPNDW